MKKIDKTYMENKKEKKMVCKKFISIAAFTSILKISLAAALFVFLSVIAAAGDTTIATGDLYTEKNNELFLSLKNTEVGGHDYRLVSAGSLGGIGNGKFAVYDATAGLTRLTIDSDGDVGIGTTNPGFKLDIIGDVRIDSTSRQITLTDSDEGGSTRLERDGSGINFDLVSSNTNLFRINDNGNVGIGTTGPGSLLHVYKNIGSVSTPTRLATIEAVGTATGNGFGGSLDFLSSNEVSQNGFIAARVASAWEAGNNVFGLG